MHGTAVKIISILSSISASRTITEGGSEEEEACFAFFGVTLTNEFSFPKIVLTRKINPAVTSVPVIRDAIEVDTRLLSTYEFATTAAKVGDAVGSPRLSPPRIVGEADEGTLVGERVGFLVGTIVGLEEAGIPVGEEVGILVGADGAAEVGIADGDNVGLNVGLAVGTKVGPALGTRVGTELGTTVGTQVGTADGDVGDKVGLLVGFLVGSKVGKAVGPVEGASVG